ncbi:MAG: hypothetical protein KJO30_11225, partial [Boseongicola sp.]|nr:hypothetical protein [Boseongicola sp.]
PERAHRRNTAVIPTLYRRGQIRKNRVRSERKKHNLKLSNRKRELAENRTEGNYLKKPLKSSQGTHIIGLKKHTTAKPTLKPQDDPHIPTARTP